MRRNRGDKCSKGSRDEKPHLGGIGRKEDRRKSSNGTGHTHTQQESFFSRIGDSC
ncbi:unnamed protein product [Periconia digitata]|uniref:Uncharacterized protein n=1 Tax=Periconia digitata TaxID=1303443 RepID=A0A9W4XIG4_9PLEO|nr:unnamed protein product [Periconia digitata]